MSWVLKQLNRIPQPYRLIVFLVVLCAFIVLFFALFSQLQSCGYDKARAEYQEKSKAWATERATLLGQVAERDKQIDQLKAKEAAYIAADAAGKKVDDALAQKIDEITKAAEAETVAIDAPADCWVRADRTCTKLAGLKPPIKINCDDYKRKICAR